MLAVNTSFKVAPYLGHAVRPEGLGDGGNAAERDQLVDGHGCREAVRALRLARHQRHPLLPPHLLRPIRPAEAAPSAEFVFWNIPQCGIFLGIFLEYSLRRNVFGTFLPSCTPPTQTHSSHPTP
eukprot:1196056-Prorocentrum_minimum.AAC.1